MSSTNYHGWRYENAVTDYRQALRTGMAMRWQVEEWFNAMMIPDAERAMYRAEMQIARDMHAARIDMHATRSVESRRHFAERITAERAEVGAIMLAVR